MAAITVKNIPDDLYEALKASAEENHRSINSEVIVSLGRLFLPKRLTVEEKLANIRKLRANIPARYVTDEIINAAKNEGRK